MGRVPVLAGLLLTLLGCGMLARGAYAEHAGLPGGTSGAPAQFAAAPAQCGPDPALNVPTTAQLPASPPAPTAASALRKGVLIVVSIPSQRLFVFKDGAEWGSTTVSTGRRGYGTPAGTFTILQKQVHHRSRTYGNAPMPYMQRLTWGGVALHAGRVTGAPASHGCIRLPWDFARQLYAVTNPASTSVVILREPLTYADAARNAALGMMPAPAQPVRQAYAPPLPQPLVQAGQPTPPPHGPVETIQLAAATNAAGADELWQELSASAPELQQLEPVILPAVVHAVQVYRLRASGPDAHAICGRLAARGIACLRVVA
jgi:lipoprotein-anchoring transpeptidase ErfK/SrfK